MNRRLVIVVTCILLGTTFIPVVESEFSGVKVPVRVSTSTGKTTEQMLSIEDVEKLSSMLNILQENPKDFEVYLPVVLRGLADLGLIEDASSLEKAILGNVKTLPSDDTSQDFEFLFNAFCFIAGWGYNSWLVTPMFFPCVISLICILLATTIVPVVNTRTFPIGYLSQTSSSSRFSGNGNTLYVGGSGPNNYTRIQDAINNANDGDTIIVYSSIYEENIVVYRSLSIIGRNYPTIGWINESEDTITIVSPNCMVLGFKISGGRSGMKILHGSMDNEIKNNIFERNDYSGLYLDRVYDTVISQNIFQNNRYCGIYLGDCNRILISDNNFSSTGHGVFGSSISECEIAGNNFLKGGKAVFISSMKSFDCIIHDNDIKSYDVGIDSQGPNLIYHNNIISNVEGIFCFSAILGGETQIFENNISKNKYGISLMNIRLGNLEIRRNNFIGNEGDAGFTDSYFISWNSNYWDSWKVPLPRLISGRVCWSFIPWVQFDWRPAREPYEWWVNG